jgi:CheY-like chemotaxis protein
MTSMSRRAGWRRFWSEPLEVGEPDFDQRPNALLEPRLARDGERLLVALPRLPRMHALLEPVVPRYEQSLDSLTSVVPALHIRTVAVQISTRKEMNNGRARILIADDHRLFAEALEAILAADERIAVAGYARDGAEAVELYVKLSPDVVLMDIAMPVLDGVEATEKIRELDPNACVLMLTGSNARADVDRARRAGAAGYVTKDRIAAELIDAIVEIASR